MQGHQGNVSNISGYRHKPVLNVCELWALRWHRMRNQSASIQKYNLLPYIKSVQRARGVIGGLSSCQVDWKWESRRQVFSAKNETQHPDCFQRKVKCDGDLCVKVPLTWTCILRFYFCSFVSISLEMRFVYQTINQWEKWWRQITFHQTFCSNKILPVAHRTSEVNTFVATNRMYFNSKLNWTILQSEDMLKWVAWAC